MQKFTELSQQELEKEEPNITMMKAKAVTDTAYLALLWCHEFCETYTTADVLTLTQLIMQKEVQSIFDRK
jgi:hypothetical protein